MERKIYLSDENGILLIVDKDNQVMINATEMAKPFGKRVSDFMRNKGTKKYIAECLKRENYSFVIGREVGQTEELNESDLYISVQKTGTWMHRILAFKFAAWLNISYQFWINATLEKLFYENLDKERIEKIRKNIDSEYNQFLSIERYVKNQRVIRPII